MFNPDKVKIGIAPIAWTEDDMPHMGADNSFKQTISEIALSGYQGTEIGCQYPRDPAILNRELARRGLQAVTAWYSSYLNTRPLEDDIRFFKDHLYFLKAIGARHVVVSDQSHSIQHCFNTPCDEKYVITDEKEWQQLAAGLNTLGRIAVENDMALLYHHHMTTTVQTTAEIDKLMALTDPAYVNLLFDTGHLTFSGEDPVDILSRHYDRIRHVHLKNVRGEVLKKVRSERKSFLRAIPLGVFTVPGDPEGMVDFPAVFRLLDEKGYEGWLIVEAEQDPDIANPLDYAKMGRAYVRQMTGL